MSSSTETADKAPTRHCSGGLGYEPLSCKPACYRALVGTATLIVLTGTLGFSPGSMAADADSPQEPQEITTAGTTQEQASSVESESAEALVSDEAAAEQAAADRPASADEPVSNDEATDDTAGVKRAESQDDPLPEADAIATARQQAAEAQALLGESSIADILNETDEDLLQIEAQISAGETEIPKAWLEARINRIERNKHRFDPDLVMPITLLGDVYARQGAYNQALDQYSRAVHIQRVSDGLVSPGQVEIVHREADVYRNMGNIKIANEREEYAYHVLRRAYQPYELSLLPGVYRLANWYQETHNIFSARALFQHSYDILTANGQGNSPEAIPALEGIAETYRLERFPPFYITGGQNTVYGSSLAASTQYDVPISINNFPQGERALQRIVQIQRDNGAGPIAVTEAVLQLADWYLLFDKTRRAFPLYKHAFDILAELPEVDEVEYFAEPRMLHYPAPSDPKPLTTVDSEDQRNGYVALAYEITSAGYVRNLKTTASVPKGMMDFRVRKSIRASRYRPMLVDGIAVSKLDQEFRHDFAYYPTPDTVAADDSGSTKSVQ